MTGAISPLRAFVLAVFLVGVGFLVGLGFQSRTYQSQRENLISRPAPSPLPVSAAVPIIKGLQSAPDGKKLAFTSVYDESSRAGIWVFDLRSRRAAFTPSPAGWQDFVNSWAPDGLSLLVEREKIPRPAAPAKAGVYRVPLQKDGGTVRASENGQSLMPELPRGERLISGFRGSDGRLYLKTRREPKRIFRVDGQKAVRLDDSIQHYGQNRVVLRRAKPSLLVVKNIGTSAQLALFRVEDGQARQISVPLGDLEWSYVSPRGNFLVTARRQSDHWQWTLFRIGDRAQPLRVGRVPLDVISVYWSPDEKHILGAAGENLWVIEIPSLKYARLGTRAPWNADDATWIGHQNAVAIAAAGTLWQVDLATGRESLLWKFPAPPWD